MKPETRARLQEFGIEELKQELLARGASVHARIAATMAYAQKDLAGNAQLAAFSSRDVAQALRDSQKTIYGVDDRKDLFQVTNQDASRNAAADRAPRDPRGAESDTPHDTRHGYDCPPVVIGATITVRRW